jgi:hypothetical protein
MGIGATAVPSSRSPLVMTRRGHHHLWRLSGALRAKDRTRPAKWTFKSVRVFPGVQLSEVNWERSTRTYIQNGGDGR